MSAWRSCRPSCRRRADAPGLRPAPALPSSADAAACSARSAFEQRLNEQLPLDLPFKDEAGQTVKLGDYFGQQAGGAGVRVLRVPDAVHAGAERPRRARCGVLDETIGKEFDVVTVSFDPRETPVLAAGKKKAYLDRYKRPSAEQGWHFLTGDEASIAALTNAAGFSYSWDEEHAAVRARQRHRRDDARRASCRATSSASTTRRATCKFALIESSDGQDRLAGRAGCCSTAITTIRRRAITGSWRCARCGSAAR